MRSGSESANNSDLPSGELRQGEQSSRILSGRYLAGAQEGYLDRFSEQSAGQRHKVKRVSRYWPQKMVPSSGLAVSCS